METTERIVEAYVRHVMGCATISNIRCDGQNEIDLLAIHPKTLARYHIEVSISISSGFKRLTAKPYDPINKKERVHQAEQRRTIGFFVEHKFAKPGVISRLAEYGFTDGNYTKVVATWDWTDDAKAQADAAGVELWDFRRMITDIAQAVRSDKTYFNDDTMRTLSLFAKAMDEMERLTPKPSPGPKSKPRKGDGAFWVYVNDPINKAILHLGTCSYCNHGQGIHPDKSGDNSVWHGPMDEASARTTARASGKKDIRWCSHCAAKLGLAPDDV